MVTYESLRTLNFQEIILIYEIILENLLFANKDTFNSVVITVETLPIGKEKHFVKES